MKPVLYRYKNSESVIPVMDGYTPGEGWVRRHLKKLVEAGRIYSDRKVNLYKTPVDHWYTKKLT